MASNSVWGDLRTGSVTTKGNWIVRRKETPLDLQRSISHLSLETGLRQLSRTPQNPAQYPYPLEDFPKGHLKWRVPSYHKGRSTASYLRYRNLLISLRTSQEVCARLWAKHMWPGHVHQRRRITSQGTTTSSALIALINWITASLRTKLHGGSHDFSLIC